MLGIGLTGGSDVVRDSGAGKGPGSGSKLGELPGLGAKLLRSSAEAGARRSGEDAAAQGVQRGGAVRSEGEGGALGRIGCRGCGLGRLKEGEPGIAGRS